MPSDLLPDLEASRAQVAKLAISLGLALECMQRCVDIDIEQVITSIGQAADEDHGRFRRRSLLEPAR